jgi:hypothetical protein
VGHIVAGYGDELPSSLAGIVEKVNRPSL